MFRRFRSQLASLFLPIRRWAYWIYTIQNRERKQLLGEVTQVAELMPLLMKQRNGYRWTKEDRSQIRDKLRRLSRISPYLIPLLMPGGFLVLPVLAWWIDRRRQQRGEAKPSVRN